MKEKFHLTDNVAILNFDLALPDTKSGLLKSEEFKAFALRYMDYLRTHDTDLYEWAAAGKREFDSKKQKKSLEALQTLHFFVKFSIFILRLFTSSVII